MIQRFAGCACILCLLSFIACAYNDEETLYPPDTCDTSQVTYSLVVAPIIESRCYDCHDQLAVVSGIPLAGYDNLKNMVDAGRLIGALRHQVGFSPMPKDRPALPECEILKIENWVAQGAPNN